MRRLAILALAALLVGCAAEPAADARLGANPALQRIAARDPAAAAAILAEADRALRAPPRGTVRSALSGVTAELLGENPLLQEVYAQDPAAGLALLERIRRAGGGRPP